MSLWNRTPHKKILAALAFVSSVITIFTFFASSLFTNALNSQNEGVSPGPSKSGAPSAQYSSERTASENTVACLDGRSRAVSCNVPHRFELVPAATQACDRVEVFNYLGGVRDVDVLIFSAVLDESGSCKVGAPVETYGPFKMVARSSSSAAWRQCVDGDLDIPGDRIPVRCDTNHVGEFTSSMDEREASPKSCMIAAGAFLGVPVGPLQNELSVTPLRNVSPGIGEARCQIAIIEGRPLSDTVRRLNNGLLPRSR